jgi:superfamily I DNA/RNA helicase
VLYDDAQSIYQAQAAAFNFASVGIEARGRTSILRLNYRNTAEVLALAMPCARHLLAADEGGGDDGEVPLVEPASAGRRGPLPVLGRLASPLEEACWVADGAAAALHDGLAAGQLAVLAPTREQLRPLAAQLRRRGLAVQGQHEDGFRRFDWAADAVKLMTLHAAKGLEFPWVAIAGLQALPLRQDGEDEALRLLYVAMTRSTGVLRLSACADTPLVARVAQALGQVAQRFAAEV